MGLPTGGRTILTVPSPEGELRMRDHRPRKRRLLVGVLVLAVAGFALMGLSHVGSWPLANGEAPVVGVA